MPILFDLIKSIPGITPINVKKNAETPRVFVRIAGPIEWMGTGKGLGVKTAENAVGNVPEGVLMAIDFGEDLPALAKAQTAEQVLEVMRGPNWDIYVFGLTDMTKAGKAVASSDFVAGRKTNVMLSNNAVDISEAWIKSNTDQSGRPRPEQDYLSPVRDIKAKLGDVEYGELVHLMADGLPNFIAYPEAEGDAKYPEMYRGEEGRKLRVAAAESLLESFATVRSEWRAPTEGVAYVYQGEHPLHVDTGAGTYTLTKGMALVDIENGKEHHTVHSTEFGDAQARQLYVLPDGKKSLSDFPAAGFVVDQSGIPALSPKTGALSKVKEEVTKTPPPSALRRLGATLYRWFFDSKYKL